MARSPSVTLIERDFSVYPVTTSSSAAAVVGFATKGPIGVPTLVSSLREFKEKFGFTSLVPFSYLAVTKAFNQGNRVIYTRVAETDGANAAKKSKRVINNISSQVDGKFAFNRSTDIPVGTSGFTNGSVYSLTVEGSDVFVSAPFSGGWYLDNIHNQMKEQLKATSGFQEVINRTISPITGAYSFDLTLDGSPLFSGGPTNNTSFLFDLSSSDTVESTLVKINDTIRLGTRGYATLNLKDTFSLEGAFGFEFNLNGTNRGVNVNFQTVTTNKESLAVAINNVFINQGFDARCYLMSDGNLIIVSRTYGASSSVSGFTAGTPDLLAEILDTDIATDVESFTGLTGIPAHADKLRVARDSNTNRVRFSSVSVGSASSISIANATIGRSFISLFDGVGTAVAGREAIAGITIGRNLNTRRLELYKTNSIVAPVSVAKVDTFGDLFVLLGEGEAIEGTPAITAAESDKVFFESKEFGSATSLITVQKTSRFNDLEDRYISNIIVFYNGEVKETFEDISLNVADDNYFETVINKPVEAGGSSWISVEAVDTNVDGKITFVDGVYNIGKANEGSTDVAYGPANSEVGMYDYEKGTDGIPQIGGENLFIDVLRTNGALANDEVYDFHYLATPDNITEAVQNAAIALSQTRGDCLYLIDPPMGLSYQQARDWHNGKYIRGTPVNTSYGAVYWSWPKEYDADNKRYVWCPPSVFMLEKHMEIDRVYAPWYAVAGDTRGKLIVQDLEYSPSLPERDELYGDLNCINPIVNFIGKGVIVYGQKTALRENKATNRINVRKMLNVVNKLTKKALNSMNFEPNNPDSWQTATNLINSILEPIRQDNGIEQYRVIADASVNTPDVVAQQMMKIVIKLIPVGTIEVIEVNLNVYKTGTTIS